MALTWHESLRDILSSAGEQIGRPKRMVDIAANYYSPGGEQVLSEGLTPDVPTTGDIVKEAAFPEEEAKKSYVESIARELAGFGTDLASDPLTYALGGGGKVGRIAGAGFTGLMAKGAVKSGMEAYEKYKEHGFTPEVAGDVTRMGLEGGGAYLGARHLLAEKVPPVHVEDTVRPSEEVPPPVVPPVLPVRDRPVRDVGSTDNTLTEFDPNRIPPGDPTRESNFRKWFGNASRWMRTPEGQPKVWYHGTDADTHFDAFDKNKNHNFGFHFGIRPDQAEDRMDQTHFDRAGYNVGKRIYPVHLNIKNPLILEHDMVDTPFSFFRAMMDKHVITPQEHRILYDQMYPIDPNDPGGVFRRQVSTREGNDIIENFLKSKGYDGIIYPNRNEGGPHGRYKGVHDPEANIAAVVFDPEQIKSAIGNRGTFDPNDPRITASTVEQPAGIPIEGTDTTGSDQQRLRYTNAKLFLEKQKPWHDFTDWYKRAMEVSKKAIIGLPQDVLPPKSYIKGAIQSVAETKLGGASFNPLFHAFNRLGFRSVPGHVEQSRPFSEGIFFNPISHLQGMAQDARDYPAFRELMEDPKLMLGDFLRRMLETQVHELVHSTGATHPLKDALGTGPNEVFDPRIGKPPKSFMEDPRIKSSENAIAGDHRFATILENALRNYESGAYDAIMKEAEPNVDSWFRTLLDANEISEGRPPSAGPVPAPEPGQPGPTTGGPTPGGTPGLPPPRLPGGPGTPGGPANPPIGGGGGKGPQGGPGTPPGTPGGKPPKIDFKKLPGHGIKEFINRRAAARTHARALRFNLKELANEGMDWVKNFEKDPTSVLSGPKVKQIFDDMASEEKRYGVPIKERQNYIYHLWEEDPETVRKSFRRLGIRPGFTQPRIYETYEEGIKAGLTPKYDNPVDIIAERMRQHKKLIADKGFYNSLRATRNIKPITKAPKDWVEVRNFPFHRYTTGKYEHVQPWAAPRPIAERLNRYLDSPISSPIRDFWQKAAGVATDIKNVVMSSGIPGTSFNAHGFNIARRIAASKDSTWGSLMKTVKTPFDLLSKGKAEEKWLTEHLPEAAKFQEAGMIFNIEDHPFKVVEGETVPKAKKPFWEEVKHAHDTRTGVISKNYGALRKMHELLFEDPLFQRALPAWKLKFAIEEEGKLLKAGLEPKEATHVAAHNANNIFGGINWVEEGRDPQFQTFLRLAMNAPDWAETNLRVGKGVVKGIFNPKDPRFQVYRNVIRNVAVYYLVTNAISRMFKGQEDYPSERHFQIRAGKAASGRTRYLKPAGTAEDWVRLPYEVTTKLAQGDLSGVADVVSARVHPMTQGLLNVVRNRNYWGRELTGPKLPILTQAGRLAHEVTDVAAPAYVKAPVAALAGEAGPEEALLKSVEAPVAYARPEPGPVGPVGRRFQTRYSRRARSGR
jgi:ADP-Ribosyltransferase in polyvalent proteins